MPERSDHEQGAKGTQRRRVGRARTLALAIPLLALWGCAELIGANFDGAKLRSEDELPDAEFVDAATEEDASEVVRCLHVTVPDVPPPSSSPNDSIEFAAAVRSINYGDQRNDAGAFTYQDIGFDLDLKCRAPGEPFGETPFCVAGKLAPPENRTGINNGLGAIFGVLKGEPALSAFTNSLGSIQDSKNIENGNFTIVLRVRGYNGRENDDQVTVDWYPTAPYAADKPTPDGGPKARPAWDGTDEWPVGSFLPDGVPDGGLLESRFKATDAYVSGGVLVTRLPSGSIQTVVPLELTQLLITGRIVRVDAGAGYGLEDGRLAGQWRMKDVFNAVPLIPASGLRICNDPGDPVGQLVYRRLKDIFCGNLDLAERNAITTTPCDSLSVGIAFSAWPARVPRRVVPETTIEAGTCPPGTEPEFDRCDGFPRPSRDAGTDARSD